MSDLSIAAESAIDPQVLDRLGGATLRNFQFFIPFSTKRTELFWASVRSNSELVALAPVVRLRRRMATAMLRAPHKTWYGLLFGPFAIKTTLLVDTSFLAYDDASPFFCRDGVDRLAVKRAVSAFLKSHRPVDSVWISEPVGDAAWATDQGYDQLSTLPMVHVELANCASLDDYAAGLSKKRRRNLRRERQVFQAAGATIETYEGPLRPAGDATDDSAREVLLGQLLACLLASADHSQFNVPYNDVLTHPDAFAAQQQVILAARAEGRVVGFMSFLQDGDRLLQCHGGLDYQRSHDVLAYHNLIYAGIELAVDRGCQVMSMGPLNNETKRRAGTSLKPITGSLWNRWPLDRVVARKLFIKNFEVYSGEVAHQSDATSEAP